MKRSIFLSIYYVLAWRIPAYLPLLDLVGRWAARGVCTIIAVDAGSNLNIRPRVSIGAGRGFRIGSNSGLGDECRLYMASTVSIGQRRCSCRFVSIMTYGSVPK